MNRIPAPLSGGEDIPLAKVAKIRVEQDLWIMENAKKQFSRHIQGMSKSFRQTHGEHND